MRAQPFHRSRSSRTPVFVLVAAASVWGAVARAADAQLPQLQQLEAGVQAAEGVRAVKRLQNSYSQYQDAGMWSELAQLFTDDATAQFPDGEVRGRNELRRYLMRQAGRKSQGLAAGQLNTRLIMQPIITLGSDGRTARGAWHEMSLLGRFGAAASWEGGIYENDYALDHGVWKISHVHFIRQYQGAYDDYGHKAPAKWDIPYHFEAAHVGVTIPQAALQSLTARVAGGAAPRHADLQHRVARMADETAVQNLQHSYGYYLDRKLWDDVADLFADRGTYEVAQRGVYVGRERIRQALEVFYGATPLRHGELFDHINLATVVSVAPDGLSAQARTTQLAQLGLNGQYAQWEVGVYENRFVKQDGVWKISALRYFPRMTTDYDLGWAKDAVPAPAVSTQFAPDRPPSQRYAAYPASQKVAFHFANPATGRAMHTPAAGGGEASAAAIASLRQQLDAAIAVDAVENLNSSYGYYIDESAWDQMADTFGSTGSKEITGAGVYVGPDRIRKILNLRGPKGGRTANFFTIHQLAQPVIHVAEDGLTARARLRLVQAGGNADGSSGSWIGGTYENTALFENGEWKFGVQDLHHSFNASYRNGWARLGPNAGTLAGRPPSPRDVRGGGITQGLGGATSVSKFSAEMPPDHAIRARQYAFPEIVEPAFHYRNPVSGRMPKELLP